MPTWGIHLLTAKKVSKEININKSDYNSFLVGNLITDVNNGYVIPNVSKIISHKQTHYYSEEKSAKTGKIMYYDIEKFIQDNKENLNNPIVLGYITHLLTDLYWNDLTYQKHGLYNENKELIGLKLNNGKTLIVDGDGRRKIKTNDFKIFTNYIYTSNFLDIPKYQEEIYDMTKQIKAIDVTKQDIKEIIKYLDIVTRGVNTLKLEYKIFDEKEMLENVDICANEIVKYFKENKL